MKLNGHEERNLMHQRFIKIQKIKENRLNFERLGKENAHDLTKRARSLADDPQDSTRVLRGRTCVEVPRQSLVPGRSTRV